MGLALSRGGSARRANKRGTMGIRIETAEEPTVTLVNKYACDECGQRFDHKAAAEEHCVLTHIKYTTLPNTYHETMYYIRSQDDFACVRSYRNSRNFDGAYSVPGWYVYMEWREFEYDSWEDYASMVTAADAARSLRGKAQDLISDASALEAFVKANS